MRIIDGATVLLVCGLLLGCGSREGEDLKTASSPAEAASQIERAFAHASEETRRAADMAAEALRRGEYEKAVVSLTTVRAATNVTFEQGLRSMDPQCSSRRGWRWRSPPAANRPNVPMAS